MTLANKAQDQLTLDHDPTSKLPSKSSQPPIAKMAPPEVPLGMQHGGMWDHDTQVYYMKRYRTQLASAPASFLSVFVGSPFENLKTRMQSHNFANAYDCFKYTVRTEGWKGLWAGTTAPLLSLTITRVAGFSVYQKAKYSLDGLIENATGVSPLQTVNTPGSYPNLQTVACFTTAGAISGAALTPFLTPFELVKNATQTSVLMSSTSDPFSTHPGPNIGAVAPTKVDSRVRPWQALRQIIASRGPLGLWTGWNLHLARDTVGSGIYFGVYEAVKQTITSYRGADQPNTMMAVATAGMFCGVMSWVFTYPLDTMKTRVQNQLVGRFASRDVSATVKEEMMKGLQKAGKGSKWKGVEMIIARSSIQNMIQMSIFEGIKTHIIGVEFSDGSTDLPKTRREKGRDEKRTEAEKKEAKKAQKDVGRDM